MYLFQLFNQNSPNNDNIVDKGQNLIIFLTSVESSTFDRIQPFLLITIFNSACETCLSCFTTLNSVTVNISTNEYSRSFMPAIYILLYVGLFFGLIIDVCHLAQR